MCVVPLILDRQPPFPSVIFQFPLDHLPEGINFFSHSIMYHLPEYNVSLTRGQKCSFPRGQNVLLPQDKCALPRNSAFFPEDRMCFYHRINVHFPEDWLCITSPKLIIILFGFSLLLLSIQKKVLFHITHPVIPTKNKL